MPGADTWDTWHGAFALYTVAALLLGHLARPLAAAAFCALVATILTLTSRFSIEQTAVLVAVPFAGGWLTSTFRWAFIGPAVYLPGTLLPLCGAAALFVEGGLATAALAALACVAFFVAPRLSARVVLVAGSAPSLLTLAALLLVEPVQHEGHVASDERSATGVTDAEWRTFPLYAATLPRAQAGHRPPRTATLHASGSAGLAPGQLLRGAASEPATPGR